MTAPTHVHGYPVLESHHTPAASGTREGYVILVHSSSPYHPYVTAWLGIEDGKFDTSWVWGHYFPEEKEARADYQARCRRGY
jgi:hypothetical protein